MKITLTDLEVEIETERIPAMIGGSTEYGETENIPAQIIITSVKSNGIELISLLTAEELSAIAEELQD